MKLRIRGNSIRIRLTRSEVERFAAGDPIEEAVDFGFGRTFGYALEVGENGLPTASFDGGRIVVTVPAAEVASWTSTDRVGIEADAGQLKLLIEKDFACLSPRPGEDESDMFENPTPENCAG